MSKSDALSGSRVLVTRPPGQAEGLVAAIAERGGRAWHFPLLYIESLEDPASERACRQRILDLDHYSQVIFVSGNAVRFGMAWIEDYWPQLPVGIEWHGVGAGTCRAMQRAGLPVKADFDGSHPMNSEALLQQPALQSPDGQKILIIRGVGGREHLREQLTARGARVDVAECYRRVAPSGNGGDLLALINREHIGTICINSGDSLTNLCDLVADRLYLLLPLRLIVPSRRVAGLARQRGFTDIHTAANASDAAVLEALLEVAV